MVWCAHLFKNFSVCFDPQRLQLVSEAEVDVFFLEFSYFFYDSVDVGNLISGSFTFSKSNLNLLKFLVLHTVEA